MQAYEKTITLSSPAFEDNGTIPDTYGCKGEGVNPQLQFAHLPESAKSLVLIMEDPDAPNGTFIHWVLWNISARDNVILENSTPIGATVGLSSAGTNAYVSPCPPSGTHRYIFKLYALDTVLDVSDYALMGELEDAINGHVIGYGELTGKYSHL